MQPGLCFCSSRWSLCLYVSRCGSSRRGRHGNAACELTHQEVGLGRRLPEVLLDVLGLVGDHANQGVELDDCHTQVDQVDAVAQQGAQRREKVCGDTVSSGAALRDGRAATVESLITDSQKHESSVFSLTITVHFKSKLKIRRSFDKIHTLCVCCDICHRSVRPNSLSSQVLAQVHFWTFFNCVKGLTKHEFQQEAQTFAGGCKQ